MAFLRAGALWILLVALALGTLFCLFFGFRSLVEVLTASYDGRTRRTGLVIAAAFLLVAALLGWAAAGVGGWVF